MSILRNPCARQFMFSVAVLSPLHPRCISIRGEQDGRVVGSSDVFKTKVSQPQDRDTRQTSGSWMPSSGI
ncbi:hypothetical protein OH77DRAFT_1431047 [Trametes cingulata]|nr:hypothetical protein OH77DRAFT_1431047 [Trametes cingulata]